MLSSKDKESFINAFNYLNFHNNIYIWYSERSVQSWSGRTDFDRWKDKILGFIENEKDYSLGPQCQNYHILGCYIISSQFLWRHYKRLYAEEYLLESVQLAEKFKDEEYGLKNISLHNIRWAEDGSPSIEYFHQASYYHLNYFYLGEINQKNEIYKKALEYYLKFVEYEPDFSPKNEFKLLYGYYDLQEHVPGSVEAYKRIGIIYEKEFEDYDEALKYYEKAIKLPTSKHTPINEYKSLKERLKNDQ